MCIFEFLVKKETKVLRKVMLELHRDPPTAGSELAVYGVVLTSTGIIQRSHTTFSSLDMKPNSVFFTLFSKNDRINLPLRSSVRSIA